MRGLRAQATSSRHYGEKDARLEYLSWRVWHLKRKKHMVRKEELDRRARAIVEDDSGAPITEEETSDEDAVGAAQRAKSDSGRQVPRQHPLQAQPSVLTRSQRSLHYSEQAQTVGSFHVRCSELMLLHEVARGGGPGSVASFTSFRCRPFGATP